jgi:hypothetical protein
MAKQLVFRHPNELASTVFRAVESSPPAVEDFFSYADMNRVVPTVDYLRTSTVSMFLTEEQLDVARSDYGLPRHTAELDLRKDKRIRWALTNENTGHIEVFGPADVLHGCVVRHT